MPTVFVYGSLLNPASIGQTLGRKVTLKEYQPVTLNGYTRTWNATAPVFSTQLKQPVTGRFLDITAKPGSQVTGAVIEVSPQEFEALKRRERGYDWVDVRPQLTGAKLPKEPVLTADFPERHATGVVFEQYLRVVQTGLAQWGKDFQQQFQKTTQPVPGPLVGGGYRFNAVG
jgi:hypothetical protein